MTHHVLMLKYPMTIYMDTEISHDTLVSVSELFISSVTSICETI